MRKEERARHANTSASSFQPKQNPQQTETCKEEDRGAAGASEVRVVGKVPRTKASERFRGWVACQGWEAGRVGSPRQSPGPAQHCPHETQGGRGMSSTWFLLPLLQDPLR